MLEYCKYLYTSLITLKILTATTTRICSLELSIVSLSISIYHHILSKRRIMRSQDQFTWNKKRSQNPRKSTRKRSPSTLKNLCWKSITIRARTIQVPTSFNRHCMKKICDRLRKLRPKSRLRKINTCVSCSLNKKSKCTRWPRRKLSMRQKWGRNMLDGTSCALLKVRSFHRNNGGMLGHLKWLTQMDRWFHPKWKCMSKLSQF